MKAERGSSMIATRSIGSVNSAPRCLSPAAGREFSRRAFSPGITRIPGTERRMSTSPNHLSPKSGRDFLNLPRFNPGLPKAVPEGPARNVNLKSSKELSQTLPPGASSYEKRIHQGRPRKAHLIQNHRPIHHEPLRRIEIRPTRENVPSISKPRVSTPIRSEIIKQTDGQNGLNMLSKLDNKRTELRRKSSELKETLEIQKRNSKILKINPVVEILGKSYTQAAPIIPERQFHPILVLKPTKELLRTNTRPQAIQAEKSVLHMVDQEIAQKTEAAVATSTKSEINTQTEIFNAKTHNQRKQRKTVESKTDEKREYESDPKANEGRRKLLKGLFRKLKKEHVTVGKLPTGAEITRHVPTTPDDSLISEIVKGSKKDGSWNALVGAIGKMKVFSESAIDSLIKSLTAVRRRPKVVDPVGPDAVKLVLSGSTKHDKQKTA